MARRRILLPLDGTPEAEQALPLALRLAEQCQAELLLLRVIAPLPFHRTLPKTARATLDDTMYALAQQYLLDVALGVTSRHHLLVQTHIAKGAPHHAIAHFAERQQVDLIVMWTQGQAGLKQRFFGSVSGRVAQAVRQPVLLVQP